jgi:hypothetical protein
MRLTPLTKPSLLHCRYFIRYSEDERLISSRFVGQHGGWFSEAAYDIRVDRDSGYIYVLPLNKPVTVFTPLFTFAGQLGSLGLIAHGEYMNFFRHGAFAPKCKVTFNKVSMNAGEQVNPRLIFLGAALITMYMYSFFSIFAC